MNTSLPQFFLAGAILALLQVLVAIPWLATLDPFGIRYSREKAGKPAGTAVGRLLTSGTVLYSLAAVVVLGGVFLGYWMNSNRSEEALRRLGRFYGSVLHFQLAVDLLIFALQGLLLVWPKGGAVALAAFREGIRQPTFWLISGMATFLILVSLVIPYFTFGEDYKMMKQLGFDAVMLASLLFGLLTVSISIHDEIEGRTAITVMSKPINRRQFLIGKYLGGLLSCAAMTLLLGWVLTWAIYIQPSLNPNDEVNDALISDAVNRVVPAVSPLMYTPEGQAVARGLGTWLGETMSHHAGLALMFGQVMVLVAIAAALATRLPFVMTLVVCMIVFMIGHLAPVLVEETSKVSNAGGGLPLVGFLAKLINVVFPALDYFQMGNAIVREDPLEFAKFVYYVGTVLIYAALYSGIALLIGLLLFEDRDLA